MPNRIITARIQGEYIKLSSGTAGAAGSHNAVSLEVSFDEAWADTSRKVYFISADGAENACVLLTTDLLKAGETDVYVLPIPSEGLASAGDMTLTVKGYHIPAGETTADRVIMSASARMTVLKSDKPSADNEPADVTAAQAEQLQGEIDTIKTTITNAETSATAAAASATAAAASAANAATAESNAGAAATTAVNAKTAAQTAQSAAEAAKSGAETAETNAKASETNAASSAASATTSKNNAATSETNAASSATAAAGSATTAATKATAAAASATAAASSEENALTYKNAAATSASASAASSSASTASMNAAASSASAAATAKAAAESAQSAAETAKTAAETAETNAGASADESEAWACGTIGGVDVPSTNAAYHNNSKYYKDQAVEISGGNYPTKLEAQGYVDTHNSASDAHISLFSAKADATALSAHTGATNNPHGVTKAQVSLGNVDNTSDANKPVSTAQQTALDVKAEKKVPATAGNIATLDASGNLADSGKNVNSFGKLLSSGNGFAINNGSIRPTLGDKAVDESYTTDNTTGARGYYSHAEGSFTTASANSAHAEGSGTTASSNSAHAEGASTTASGPTSHAEGGFTTASGFASHAEGEGTIASGEAQHVGGTYNIEDTTSLEIIGNGTYPEEAAEPTRSNARTLDALGNGWFAGTIQPAGGYKAADGTVGATGTFTSGDGKTVTVKNGLIVSIV